MPRRAIQKIARTLIIEHSSKSPGADSKNGDIINVTKMSPAIHGKAELIIGKQRHGPVGTIELAFDGRYTRFGNLAKSYENKSQ